MSARILHKKVCLLGNFGVGKTSLVRRFVYDRFDDSYLTTLGVKISQKLSPPVEWAGSLWQINFLIWDVEGFEEASPLQKNYLLGAAGALLVGDLARPETLAALPQLADQLRDVAGGAAVVPVANKADLLSPADLEELTPSLKQVGHSLGSDTVITSAKTGESVEDAFLLLAQRILENHDA